MRPNSLFSQGVKRFRKHRLSYYSFLFLILTTFMSFFAKFICNDKPLMMHFEGKWYFPGFHFYSAKVFGEESLGELNYKLVEKTEKYQRSGNWMLFAPIRHGVNEVSENLPKNPPSYPTKENLLGTDDRGRDLLTRLIYGYRNSMLFALGSWICVALLGYLIGGVQGFWGGNIDFFGQRLVEIWSSLPILYVIIFLLSIFPPSFILLISVWVAFGWVSLSGYVRAEVLKVRKKDFVQAAEIIGGSQRRLLWRHVLPNALNPLITFSPFIISASIGSLAALDYLGLGLPPPAASWGELLKQGKDNLSSWWLSLFPVTCLFVTLLLLNFVGEGIRDAFDIRENA